MIRPKRESLRDELADAAQDVCSGAPPKQKKALQPSVLEDSESGQQVRLLTGKAYRRLEAYHPLLPQVLMPQELFPWPLGGSPLLSTSLPPLVSDFRFRNFPVWKESLCFHQNSSAECYKGTGNCTGYLRKSR
jgi:hypothetical protein